MRGFAWCAAAALGLGCGAAPAADPPAKAPDWSGYVYVADVVGEVVKADDKKVVLRITWFEAQSTGGGRSSRPNLSGNHRHFRNPFAANMNRPHVQVKEQHHDYELEYLPESLVRLKKLPAKTDANGKPASYTQKELDELRAPSVVPGYAASRADVVPGMYLDVILIRDKTIAAGKATEDDLRIKYATILGKDPNPPKDIASGSDKKDPKKKN
jgi:hypothetical protein